MNAIDDGLYGEMSDDSYIYMDWHSNHDLEKARRLLKDSVEIGKSGLYLHGDDVDRWRTGDVRLCSFVMDALYECGYLGIVYDPDVKRYVAISRSGVIDFGADAKCDVPIPLQLFSDSVPDPMWTIASRLSTDGIIRFGESINRNPLIVLGQNQWDGWNHGDDDIAVEWADFIEDGTFNRRGFTPLRLYFMARKAMRPVLGDDWFDHAPEWMFPDRAHGPRLHIDNPTADAGALSDIIQSLDNPGEDGWDVLYEWLDDGWSYMLREIMDDGRRGRFLSLMKQGRSTIPSLNDAQIPTMNGSNGLDSRIDAVIPYMRAHRGDLDSSDADYVEAVAAESLPAGASDAVPDDGVMDALERNDITHAGTIRALQQSMLLAGECGDSHATPNGRYDRGANMSGMRRRMSVTYTADSLKGARTILDAMKSWNDEDMESGDSALIMGILYPAVNDIPSSELDSWCMVEPVNRNAERIIIRSIRMLLHAVRTASDHGFTGGDILHALVAIHHWADRDGHRRWWQRSHGLEVRYVKTGVVVMHVMAEWMRMYPDMPIDFYFENLATSEALEPNGKKDSDCDRDAMGEEEDDDWDCEDDDEAN